MPSAPEGAPALPYVLVQSPGGWTAHLPGDPASWEHALSPEAAVGKLVQRYPEAFGARPAALPATPGGADRLAAIRRRVARLESIEGGFPEFSVDEAAFLLSLVDSFTSRAALSPDLEAIAARCSHATDGPMVVWPGNRRAGFGVEATAGGRHVAVAEVYAANGCTATSNAAFYAHARTDIPAMLALLARIRASLVHPDGDQAVDLAYAAEQTARQLADEIERLGQKQAEVDALDARVTALNGELVAARAATSDVRAYLTKLERHLRADGTVSGKRASDIMLDALAIIGGPS